MARRRLHQVHPFRPVAHRADRPRHRRPSSPTTATSTIRLSAACASPCSETSTRFTSSTCTAMPRRSEKSPGRRQGRERLRHHAGRGDRDLRQELPVRAGRRGLLRRCVGRTGEQVRQAARSRLRLARVGHDHAQKSFLPFRPPEETSCRGEQRHVRTSLGISTQQHGHYHFPGQPRCGFR